MNDERSAMIAHERKTTVEKQVVADRVRALERQIDEQNANQERIVQVAASAARHERDAYREAESAEVERQIGGGS